MTLKERITEDMKAAMRAKETARLSAIRLLLAAMKQKEVDERVQLGDAEVIAIIEKLLKQRRESVTQFEAAGRTELAAGEKFEIEVLTAYLPQRMSEAEVAQAIQAAIAETGAASARDMGKVMGLLKTRLAGRADMTQVSALVKAKLAG
jgi:uncharacterized protein YqeY